MTDAQEQGLTGALIAVACATAAWLALRVQPSGEASAWVGPLCAALCCLSIGLLPARAQGRKLLPADALAPWLLALDGAFAPWLSVDVALSALFLSTGLWALAGEVAPKPPRSRSTPAADHAEALKAAQLDPPAPAERGAASGAWLGLAAALRPEQGLWLLTSLLARRSMVKASIDGGARAEPRLALRWASLAAVPLALGALALWWHLGLPRALPNAGGSGADWLRGWWRSRPGVHHALWLAPLVLLTSETRRSGLVALAALLPPLFWVPLRNGDARFFAAAMPQASLLAALAAIALGEAAGWLPFAIGMGRLVKKAAAPKVDDAEAALEVIELGMRGVRVERAVTALAAAVLLGFAAAALRAGR